MKALFFGSIGVLAETSELQRQAFNSALERAGLICAGILPLIAIICALSVGGSGWRKPLVLALMTR